MAELKELKEIKFVSPEKLVYYDAKAKARMEAADEAIRAALQANITAEETRAKAAELANAQAAEAAQTAADNAQAHSEALAAKVGEVAEGKTVVEMIEEAQTAATYDDEEVRGLISDLDTNKADKEQVAKDIAEAVKAEEDARKEAVKGVQDAVDALAGTHATDKAALEGAIALKADKAEIEEVIATLEEKVDDNEEDIEQKMTDLTARVAANETAVGTTLPNAIALKADQTALEELANAAATKEELEAAVEALEAEDERIAGLVADEVERATGVEADHEERIVKMEAFFVGAAEDEGEGESLKNALDTLVEIQKYIDDDGAAADEMIKDIAANEKAIADHVATNHDFAGADATLKAELIDEINKKANQTALEEVSAVANAAVKQSDYDVKVKALEDEDARIAALVAEKDEAQSKALADAVAALEGVDAGQEERLAAIEARFEDGEGSVEDMIADAVATEKAEREAADAEVLEKAEQGIADAATAQAAAEAADEKAQKAQDEVDALEEVVETKADATDLTELAGRVDAEEEKSADHEARIATLEAVKFTEITDAEIDALFE